VKSIDKNVLIIEKDPVPAVKLITNCIENGLNFLF